MSAKVQLVITVLKDVLYVPVQSVTTIDKKQVCYVLEGADFAPHPVVGGKYNDSFIEITSGLKEGDIVKLNAPAPQGGKSSEEIEAARSMAPGPETLSKMGPQGQGRRGHDGGSTGPPGSPGQSAGKGPGEWRGKKNDTPDARGPLQGPSAAPVKGETVLEKPDRAPGGDRPRGDRQRLEMPGATKEPKPQEPKRSGLPGVPNASSGGAVLTPLSR
jgi:hypothetical protein